MALPFLLADSSVMDEDGADFPYVAHALLRSRVVSFRLSVVENTLLQRLGVLPHAGDDRHQNVSQQPLLEN